MTTSYSAAFLSYFTFQPASYLMAGRLECLRAPSHALLLSSTSLKYSWPSRSSVSLLGLREQSCCCHTNGTFRCTSEGREDFLGLWRSPFLLGNRPRAGARLRPWTGWSRPSIRCLGKRGRSGGASCENDTLSWRVGCQSWSGAGFQCGQYS